MKTLVERTAADGTRYVETAGAGTLDVPLRHNGKPPWRYLFQDSVGYWWWATEQPERSARDWVPLGEFRRAGGATRGDSARWRSRSYRIVTKPQTVRRAAA